MSRSQLPVVRGAKTDSEVSEGLVPTPVHSTAHDQTLQGMSQESGFSSELLESCSEPVREEGGGRRGEGRGGGMGGRGRMKLRTTMIRTSTRQLTWQSHQTQ